MAKVVKGMEQLKRNLDSFKRESKTVLIKGVFNGNVRIANRAKVDHPYIDRTGNLTGSIQAEKPEVSIDKISGETTAGMEYAPHVELGSSNSRPYPFMFPALDAESQGIINGLRSILRTIRWIE